VYLIDSGGLIRSRHVAGDGDATPLRDLPITLDKLLAMEK
jgi:hypothetical protein